MQNKSSSGAIVKTSDDKQRRLSKLRETKVKTVRFNLTMSKPLLDRVDKAAQQDYTTRSDIIREALLWYLRPQGRDFDKADLDTLFEALKHRRAQAGMRKMLKELGM